MRRLWASFLLAIWVSFGASAQSIDTDSSEASEILQAAWGAALILPEEKQKRLAPAFLEIAMRSGDKALVSVWESRFQRSAEALTPHVDYGWQTAKPILQEGGVKALINLANRRAAPLSFGRSDALLAAGRKLYASQPADARKINEAMLELISSASSFERPVLSHAAAELAMIRCDARTFGLAEMSTTAPGNFRYAFWRARIEGNALDLLDRIRAIETDQDTREVRRVLEGYRAIQEFGYCSAPNGEIGG